MIRLKSRRLSLRSLAIAAVVFNVVPEQVLELLEDGAVVHRLLRSVLLLPFEQLVLRIGCEGVRPWQLGGLFPEECWVEGV